MSEYQCHEWQTVDRGLTREEQAAVSGLSSHIEVSSSQAVVTYHWSSFRHDPKQVLLKYFDAYFYLANWGSLRLMFRFPGGLLDEATIEPYCLDPWITCETVGEYQVLDLDFGDEEGDGWMEAEVGLSHFIWLRADLLEGDYRLLYLAWLKAATFPVIPNRGRFGGDTPTNAVGDREPPVPAGLQELSPALWNFAHIFGLDPFLVQAAAEASSSLGQAPSVDYRRLIARLPRAERDDYLARLAEGDPGTRLALRKRLRAFWPQERPERAEPRTFQQLLQRARHLEEAEKQRRAEAARQAHVAEMTALAAREEGAWREVDTLVSKGRMAASVYDEATGMLEKLQELSGFQDTRDTFEVRIQQLAAKYASRKALIGRWKERGWV